MHDTQPHAHVTHDAYSAMSTVLNVVDFFFAFPSGNITLQMCTSIRRSVDFEHLKLKFKKIYLNARSKKSKLEQSHELNGLEKKNDEMIETTNVNKETFVLL